MPRKKTLKESKEMTAETEQATTATVNLDSEEFQEMSTKDKVRYLALEEGMTRKDIAEALDVKYQYVQRILRGVEGVKDGPTGSSGKARSVEIEHRGETKPRVQWIKELHNEGLSPSEIARELDIPYQYAYSTLRRSGQIMPGEGKPGGGGPRIFIEFEGEERPRAEVIRTLAERDMTRGQIAKELDVPYQVVYNALKSHAKKQSEALSDADNS